MPSKLSLLIFLIALSTGVFSQGSLDNDKFSNLRLHIDKKYFLPGETVFFKAYFVPGDTTQNITCTVSLIDEKNKLLQSKKLILGNSAGSSYFILPDIDAAKFYTIQYYLDAYSSPVIYSKQIFSSIATASGTAAALTASQVDFIPEAGNVITALPKVVYFKIKNLPAAVFPMQGAVTDVKGDTINYFTTTQTGTGRVEVNDSTAGPLYLVYEYLNQQYQKEIPLPASQLIPALLNLYPMNDGVICRIRTMISDSFQIKAAHGGMTYYYGSVYLQAGDDFSKILKDTLLAAGINHITLSSNGKEIASRSYYVEPSNLLNINKVSFTKDDSLHIAFNKPAAGIYSVCVHTLKEAGIKNSKPVAEADRKAANDIALQLSPSAKRISLPKPPDSIAVTLKDDNNRDILTDGLVNVFVTAAGDKFIMEKRTNREGQLFLDRRLFNDSVTIAFFPKDKNRSNDILTPVYNPESIAVDTAALEDNAATYSLQYEMGDTTSGIAAEFKRSKAKMMDEVVVKSRRRVKTNVEVVEEKYASGMFTSNVHNIAKFDMINEYQTQAMGDVSSFLRGRIPGGDYYAYLNENQVDLSMINSMPLSEVAFISVMGRNFVTFSTKGMTILVYTKKGVNVSNNSNQVKTNTIKVNGYASDKDYYDPLFTNTSLENKYRTTLYWNSYTTVNGTPGIKVKVPGKPTGPVEITIMGFDENGEFVSLTKVVETVE